MYFETIHTNTVKGNHAQKFLYAFLVYFNKALKIVGTYMYILIFKTTQCLVYGVTCSTRKCKVLHHLIPESTN